MISRETGKTATALAGLFSVSTMVFWRGGDDETHQASDQAKKMFLTEHGDLVAVYKVYQEWMNHKKSDPSHKSKVTVAYHFE